MELTTPLNKAWYIFNRGQILLERQEDRWVIPSGETSPIQLDHAFPAVTNDGLQVMAGRCTDQQLHTDEYTWMKLRQAYDVLDQQSYDRAGKVAELIHWDLHSLFCPACGSRTEHVELIMKRCPQCGNEIFPSVCPAIIVLIRKGDAVLLVRAHNFSGSFHGLVAGFVETGETLEECVEREVMEETGLKITNITYYASQPWPYPMSLMIGFMADYVSGELRLQDNELASAGFFTKDHLPELPRKLSLARRLVDAWLAEQPQ